MEYERIDFNTGSEYIAGRALNIAANIALTEAVIELTNEGNTSFTVDEVVERIRNNTNSRVFPSRIKRNASRSLETGMIPFNMLTKVGDRYFLTEFGIYTLRFLSDINVVLKSAKLEYSTVFGYPVYPSTQKHIVETNMAGDLMVRGCSQRVAVGLFRALLKVQEGAYTTLANLSEITHADDASMSEILLRMGPEVVKYIGMPEGDYVRYSLTKEGKEKSKAIRYWAESSILISDILERANTPLTVGEIYDLIHEENSDIDINRSNIEAFLSMLHYEHPDILSQTRPAGEEFTKERTEISLTEQNRSLINLLVIMINEYIKGLN